MRISDEILEQIILATVFWFFYQFHPFSSPDVRANFETARYRQILFQLDLEALFQKIASSFHLGLRGADVESLIEYACFYVLA